jgi:serine/threonine-protein kinase
VVLVWYFGLARVGGASALTRRGHLLGTIHYCAPELVVGDAVDPRVDVFSVGAIAFELLAWRRPFEAESVAAVLSKLLEQPVDPAPLPHNDDSPGLERVVLKALERDPARRHASLDAMREELLEVVRETAAKLSAAP